jgi:hypothetical protein
MRGHMYNWTAILCVIVLAGCSTTQEPQSNTSMNVPAQPLPAQLHTKSSFIHDWILGKAPPPGYDQTDVSGGVYYASVVLIIVAQGIAK